jgi:kinesin family protein 3/17
MRCRPISEDEKRDNRKIVVTMDTTRGEIQVKNPKAEPGEPPKTFTFDTVYDWNSKQENVYNESAYPIVDSVLEGYNGTIFAYGQTGTGKTFTMEGPAEPAHLKGIIPRAFEHVFKAINSTTNKQWMVRASMLELYNEEVRDLLSKNTKNKLELREKPDVGVYVKDLSAFIIQDVQEMNDKLVHGRKSRAVAATDMNAGSSRSHCLFTITVESSDIGVDGQPHIVQGKLNLVDLAGSERQDKTNSSGETFNQAIHINQSLTTLGNVISALVSAKSSHVPYRDSKLTRLLQDSLGGNTKTVMIANIGPVDYNFDETVSTLRYANRAKSIKNKPKINEDPKDTMLRQYQDEISKLKEQLAAQMGGQVSEGGTIVQRKVVERIVKVQDEAQIRAIEEKLAKEKEEIRRKAEEERAKIENQKNMAEEEKQRLLIALKEKEDAQRHAKEIQEKTVTKLKDMEAKITMGTKAMETAVLQEKELQKVKKELDAKKRKEQQMAEELAKKEEENLLKDKQFISKQEEIEDKKKKIQKVFNKYQQTKAEIQDIQDEFTREREAYSEQIRELTRQLKMKSMVIDSFIPVNEINKIELRAQWSDEIDDWILPNFQLSGNELRKKKPSSALGLKRPMSEYARLARNLGDQNPRFRYDNIMQLDLDVGPDKYLDEFDGNISPKVQHTINTALDDDDDEGSIFNLENQPNCYLAVHQGTLIDKEPEPQTQVKNVPRVKTAMKRPQSGARISREPSSGNPGPSGPIKAEPLKKEVVAEDNFPKARGLVAKRPTKA